MLVEIRHYTIKPGRRDEFVAWFEAEVLPAMTRAGMTILGVFTGVEDPDSFFYWRSFRDEAERAALTEAFYSSNEWLGGMKEKALEMETGYDVHLVRSTAASPI